MTITAPDLPTVTRPVQINLDLIAQLDVCDPEVGEHHEHVDIGPFPGRTLSCPVIYYRLRSGDLLKDVAAARRLLDDIETAVLDARADAQEARMRPCPFCPTLIDPALDDTCGSRSCFVKADAEARVEAYL